MGLGERVCLGLNRLFPKRKVPGRESPKSYFEADQAEAEQILGAYGPALRIAGQIVLDGGCGLGGKTLYCALHGATYVVGLDNDLQHVGYATEFTRAKQVPNLTFLAANLRDLPFPADLFDAILLNGVVEHIRRPDLRPAMAECKRVLKTGGILCALFMPWTGPSAAHVYDYIHIPWCQYLFSRGTIAAALRKLRPAPRYGRLSYVEHFLELNQITIEEFKHLTNELGFVTVLFQLHMIKNLRVLAKVSVINKYLTSHVVAVLRKSS
ncbi:MAG: methyltransferase domain-containing protein [Candidatus Oleimicrobiaceae bacterium]